MPYIAIVSYFVYTRSYEEQFIRSYLSGVPARPLVIVGPEGCGKSTLIRKVSPVPTELILVALVPYAKLF